jgi:ribosome-binding factor A
MASYRQGRIEEEMAKVLSDILRTVKDYRVTDSLISITGVSVAPDLKTAKIFFSAMGGKYDSKEIRKGLTSASGYIRSQLAHIMNLRQTPALTFVFDDSMEHGAHINTLLRKVETELQIAEERDRLEEAEKANQAEDSNE